MSTIVFQEHVRIPHSVVDLESFRAWAKSEEFPERGRYSFINGELWVDLMPEQLFTHNGVKVEFARVLHTLMRTTRRGRFFGDGILVTNVEAGLSTEPDGTVVLFESLKLGRSRLIELSSGDGYVEVDGAPDIALEIVSASSVRKDTVVLRELYWKAGIPEYWLVDVRGAGPKFDILARGRRGYGAARKQSGWVKSHVLGKLFRLTGGHDATGNPEYTLIVR